MRHLFPGQQNDEIIELVVREHWFFLIVRLLIVFGLFIVLMAVQTYGPGFVPGLFTGTAGKVVTLFSQVYVMILVFATFIICVFYYLNMQIITNLRVVDIDQYSIFSRSISELHIDKIEDVSSESNGPFAVIFGYGNVYVQTAGTVDRFEFDRVPEPERIVKLVLNLYEQRPQTKTPRVR